MAKKPTTGDTHIGVTTVDKNNVSTTKVVDLAVVDGRVVADPTSGGVKQ